jgi:hypothetical protein
MLYRLWMPLINEAFFIVMEGTSSPEDVRILCRHGALVGLWDLFSLVVHCILVAALLYFWASGVLIDQHCVAVDCRA